MTKFEKIKNAIVGLDKALFIGARVQKISQSYFISCGTSGEIVEIAETYISVQWRNYDGGPLNYPKSNWFESMEIL